MLLNGAGINDVAINGLSGAVRSIIADALNSLWDDCVPISDTMSTTWDIVLVTNPVADYIDGSYDVTNDSGNITVLCLWDITSLVDGPSAADASYDVTNLVDPAAELEILYAISYGTLTVALCVGYQVALRDTGYLASISQPTLCGH